MTLQTKVVKHRSIILCFIISRSISFLAPMSSVNASLKMLLETVFVGFHILNRNNIESYNVFISNPNAINCMQSICFLVECIFHCGKTFMNVYFIIFNNVMTISIINLLLYNKFTYWCILSMREIRYSIFPAGLSPLTSVRCV